MKQKLLLLALLILILKMLPAQAPQAINYQAVLRDSEGEHPHRWQYNQ